MDKTIPIFTFASPEIQELLADNKVDLPYLLSQEGVDIEQGFAQNPAADPESGERDPSTVILASAALAVALTPIISRVLNSLTHESIIVQEIVLVPVEDSSGNVVYGTSGSPVLQWVERTKILESSEKTADKDRFTIEGFGIKISFGNEEMG